MPPSLKWELIDFSPEAELVLEGRLKAADSVETQCWCNWTLVPAHCLNKKPEAPLHAVET